MYLRNSKWSMRQRRRKINWFFVALVILLIAIVTYLDRFVLTVQSSPFSPTATITREPESYITEAEALFNEGKLIDSIDTYMEAIRLRPDDAAIYVALARVQIFAGRYDEALINTENALLLNPDNSMSHALRGWALTQQGDYVAADTSIQTALRLDPNNGLAHAYNAFLYGQMAVEVTGPYVDPIQTAIAESKVAKDLAPNSLEVRWARAFILQITDVGNLQEAIQEYQAAIAINPNISRIHLDLGVAYRSNGNIDEAIQQYTIANTLNPTDYLPDLYSSRALLAISEFEKAAQYAESAVRDAPTDPYLRGNWGYALFKQNQLSLALEQMTLTVSGGLAEDGQVIPPIEPAGDDIWIGRYYSVYAILLAQDDRCNEALPVTQVMLDVFRANEDAIYNAEYVQGICADSSKSSEVTEPTTTPEATPTP